MFISAIKNMSVLSMNSDEIFLLFYYFVYQLMGGNSFTIFHISRLLQSTCSPFKTITMVFISEQI